MTDKTTPSAKFILSAGFYIVCVTIYNLLGGFRDASVIAVANLNSASSMSAITNRPDVRLMQDGDLWTLNFYTWSSMAGDCENQVS